MQLNQPETLPEIILTWIKSKKSVLLHSLFTLTPTPPLARMAELVDALVSGTSIHTDVQVRVLFRAQTLNKNPRKC
jgi:hypothetical protein